MMTSTTIQQFFEYLAQLEEAFTGLERIDDYLHRSLEKGAVLPITSNISFNQNSICDLKYPRKDNYLDKINEIALSVKFKNITLKYDSRDTPALDDISFTIEAGEHVGIIGATGSGKSSLLQALFLLYPIESGVIEVGKRICNIFGEGDSKFTLDDYRHHFSYIPQDPFIFRGSLRENITNDIKIEDDKIVSVLQVVGLQEWMEKLIVNLSGKNSLTDILSYNIEERGGNLSAGQKQLFCLARCLLQDAPILVMDEATSNIDPLSEQHINTVTQTYFAKKNSNYSSTQIIYD